MKTIFGLALACIALAATPAFAIYGALQGSEVNGNLQYCYYSNGVILTVSSVELCPISVD